MFRLADSSTRRFALLALCAALPPAAGAVDVRICTDRGAIELALNEQAAPQHVSNFIDYVEDGFYSGTVLHRVVPDSMVQGGRYDLSLQRREARDPVANESFNGLSNLRGTIAASREADPDSATSQFFINLTDNSHLDAELNTPGYTVFGHVTAGLDVLDAISRLPTRRAGNLSEAPASPVELTSVTVLTRASQFGLSVEPDPASLRTEFEMALARRDSTETLTAIDALRRSCAALDSRQLLAEAEAATALQRFDRARYSLEQYLARAGQLDPLRQRAERLYAALPQLDESNLDEHIAHCRRPPAPSIPRAELADLESLRAVESDVRRHRQLGEFYLSCITRVLDSGELNEQEMIDATALHNEIIAELTAVATRFNATVQAFKEAND